MNDEDDIVICPICGFKSTNLTLHIRKHNLSTESFRKQYPGLFLRAKRLRNNHSKLMKINNPMLGKNHTCKSKNKISKHRTGCGIGVCDKYIRTPKIKTKISLGVTKAHLNGRLYFHGRGKWLFSKKNNKWMWLASSYEIRVFNILENNPFFIKFEREQFSIPYKWNGAIKHYIPDF